MSKPHTEKHSPTETGRSVRADATAEEILELSREEKLNEEDILRQALEERRKKLEAAESRAQDLYRQLLSLKADFDNFRKRAEREKEQRYLNGKMAVLEPVIGLYETFSKGLASLPAGSSDVSALVEGVHLLYREFEQMLSREGVQRMECVGTLFDPGRHEVVESEVRDDLPDGTITAVLSEGFILKHADGDVILRTARVRVSRSTGAEKGDGDETGGSGGASQ